MSQNNKGRQDKKEPEKAKEQSLGKIVERSITAEMRDSYLDYAMSVITSRALPDARDGLKPVHRRILYAMHEKGLTASAKFRKSATVVGDVLGSYHPHGDISVYDAMVKMAQDFSFRYPLVLGQGNFGSIDGDSPAAYRYTEAKMSRLSEELLRDLEKETVSWRANYDGTKKEPSVLPAAVPNLLLNGTLGIAVGMATNIPPHNLSELVSATIHLIDDKEATTEDLLTYIKGPDFPTGGIVYASKDMNHAYATGKGGVTVRGEAEIIENKNGMFQIIITSIPFRVNKSDMIIKIADLVREKKIEGIKDLRDESTKDIRVVIDLKQGSFPQNILNYLYKHTQLEETFHFNIVALVDGVPKTLSLKSVLAEFVSHRQEVVRKRTEFDLKKAEEREHILFGLNKALDHIDKIIKLIKASKNTEEAHANLMKEFKFSSIQAMAILDMKLQRLSGLERKKIEEELKNIQALIISLKDLLKSPKAILKVIKDELEKIKEKYGDERRTKIVKGGVKDFKPEDVIPDVESVLVLTRGGYIKRTQPSEYKKQKRGGVGVVDLDTKEEDFVTHILNTNTHSDLLFFSDKGKAYQIKMYDLPEGRRATKGKSIVNYLSLTSDEKITSILPLSNKQTVKTDLSLFMVTKKGIGKRVEEESLRDVRRSGLIAIKLSSGDELKSVLLVEKGDEVTIGSAKGQSIRFKQSDVRVMGRNAAGVRVIKLSDKDYVVNADSIKKDYKNSSLFVVTSGGYGKKTDLKNYKVQKRGGSGIKTVKLGPKSGELISLKVVGEEGDDEVVAISKKSQVIRLDIKEVPFLGRQTQGVRIMRLRPNDYLASVVCI